MIGNEACNNWIYYKNCTCSDRFIKFIRKIQLFTKSLNPQYSTVFLSKPYAKQFWWSLLNVNSLYHSFSLPSIDSIDVESCLLCRKLINFSFDCCFKFQFGLLRIYCQALGIPFSSSFTHSFAKKFIQTKRNETEKISKTAKKR